MTTAIRAARALVAGDWHAAERLSSEALSAGLATNEENAAIVFGAQQYLLHYERGGMAVLVPSIRENIARFPKVPVWRATMAVASSELANEREARSELEVLAADGFESLPEDFTLPGMLASLSIAVSFLADAARAELLYARLLPFAGLNVVMGFAVGCMGAADRFLGLLAATMSRWEDAARHFDAALEMHRRMGAGPFVARTQYEYADMLLRRGEPDDAAKAESLLREAVATARNLGMDRLLELSEGALAKLGVVGEEGAPAATAPATVAMLRREGELWTIGWQGKSFRLKASKGLGYIQRLVGEPGRELHCVDIADDEAMDLGDAGPVLDGEAKAAYRRRLEDLRDELAEAVSNNDSGRDAKAREEMAVLGRELSSAIGLGGRDRRAGGNVERARIRVTRAIRDAVARIRQHDASLGQHLSNSIKTGAFCSYTPDPTSPITWKS